MPKPKLQVDADGYRIVGSDEGEGDVVDFGVQATYDSEDGKEHLAALVDLDASDEPITCLPGGAWITDTGKGTSMMDVELEEVEFDEGEAEFVLDGEEEEGDGDDDLIADEEDEEEGDDDDEEEIEELKS